MEKTETLTFAAAVKKYLAKDGESLQDLMKLIKATDDDTRKWYIAEFAKMGIEIK